MILFAAAFALAQPHQPPAPRPETDEGRAAECQRAVRRNPQAALDTANQWRAAGGGLHARQCIGLAYVALERWPLAATTFEQAAQEAERNGDARAGDFWVQAGNAWLAGGERARALAAFDTALRSTNFTSEMRGEIHLDRARALVAESRLADARTELDKALALVAADPMAWYLSAALARRQRDLSRARTDIARARQLARDNPDILLLAGTIAGETGDMAEAERIYRQVAQGAPNTPAGRAAQESLATARDVTAPGSPPTPPQAPAPRPN